jgi:hypothetical protein
MASLAGCVATCAEAAGGALHGMGRACWASKSCRACAALGCRRAARRIAVVARRARRGRSRPSRAVRAHRARLARRPPARGLELSRYARSAAAGACSADLAGAARARSARALHAVAAGLARCAHRLPKRALVRASLAGAAHALALGWRHRARAARRVAGGSCWARGAGRARFTVTLRRRARRGAEAALAAQQEGRGAALAVRAFWASLARRFASRVLVRSGHARLARLLLLLIVVRAWGALRRAF